MVYGEGFGVPKISANSSVVRLDFSSCKLPTIDIAELWSFFFIILVVLISKYPPIINAYERITMLRRGIFLERHTKYVFIFNSCFVFCLLTAS